MIIRTGDSALLLITQPDHAALAARIMRHWVSGDLKASSRYDDILAAVEAHDDGWITVDAAPLVDAATGKLLDFMTAPDAAKQGVWPRAVDGLRHFPYRAALVAHHAVYVYARNRSNPEWDAFFAQMEAMRDRALAAVPGATQQDLLADYKYVRMGDLLSLTFCNEWSEVNADEQGFVLRFDGTRVSIAPDPFGGREVPIEISARRLPNRAYTSPADAEEAWRSARQVTLTGVITGND